MIGTNKVFILGFLGSAPQTRNTKSGSNYTALSVATHRFKGDEKKEKATDWHYVRVWGKQGETCAKFLTKGQFVHIEGYLTQYAQEREGKIERHTGINALRVDFLPRANNDFAAPSAVTIESPTESSEEPSESAEETIDSASATSEV